MVRMMVPISTLQGLNRHAEKTRSLPEVNARLHQPCRSRMPQSMRADLAFEPGETNGSSERRFYGSHRFAVELDQMIANDPFGFPTPQVGQQARGQGHWRLTL